MTMNNRRYPYDMKYQLLLMAIGVLVSTPLLAYEHPCMLHTQADINTVKSALAASDAVTTAAYSHLKASSYAQSTYTNNTSQLGSDHTLKRMDATNWGPTGTFGQYSDYNNYTALMYDAAAAYQLALRYQLSGETPYADAAVGVLNAWAANCTGLLRLSGYANNIPDPNEYLILIQAHQLANAAELLRGYSGWTAADFTTFQSWMRTTFYDVAHLFLSNHHAHTGDMTFWLSWDLTALTAELSVGILCDDTAIVSEAIDYFKTSSSEAGYIRNAVPYLHSDPDSDETLGQCMEAGRDQGHATLCASLMGTFCQMALNVGEDLFAYDDYRALRMAEYLAKYNLRTDATYTSDTPSFLYDGVPYTSYSNPSHNCPTLSDDGRGTKRPCWEVFSNYAYQHGQSAIYCKKWVQQMRTINGWGDGGGGDYGSLSGGFDQLGYQTLMFGAANGDLSLSGVATPTDMIDCGNATAVSRITDDTFHYFVNDGKRIMTFTPTEASEVGMTFVPNDYTINNTQNYFVLQTSSGAVNAGGAWFNCKDITIDGTNYDGSTRKAVFTVGDTQVIIFSPLATGTSAIYSKFIGTADDAGMGVSQAKIYFTANTTDEVTVYRAGFYNLGEILELYPTLKTKNWQFVSADGNWIESYGSDNSGADGTDGTIRVKDGNTAKATIAMFRQQMRSLGTLPSNYTKVYFYYYLVDDDETPATEDLLTPMTGLTFTFTKEVLKYFPTLTPMKVVADGCYYWGYKDGVEALKSNFFVFQAWSNRLVDFTRSFTEGYNSCIVPFEVDVSELPNGLTAYTAFSYADGTICFTEAAGDIAANTPFIIHAETSGLYIIPSTNDADPTDNPASYQPVSVGSTSFVGSYVQEIPSGDYASTLNFGLKADGSAFARMGSETKTSYYRAFLALPSSGEVNARQSIAVNFGDDEVTGISTLNHKPFTMGSALPLGSSKNQDYNLSGQRVAQPTKGLYIIRSAEGRLQGKNGIKLFQWH